MTEKGSNRVVVSYSEISSSLNVPISTHGMLDFTPQEEREMPFDYKLLVTFGESKKDEDN